MTKNGQRLTSHPSQQIDPARRVTFRYNGEAVEAFEGDTVASALYAAGRRIFTRSFKYHRPRGLLCCSGDCPNCLMQIDKKPNVRACRTPVREGLQAFSQHAWPSADRDFLHLIERFERLLPIGFYYKTLYKPRWLWKMAEPVIRKLAGLGRVAIDGAAEENFEHQYEYADVLVVGGGPGGIAAALHAASQGASVILADNEEFLGGHLRYETRLYRYESVQSGHEVARTLQAKITAQAQVRVFSRATAFGSYEGGLVPLIQGNKLTHICAKALVVATGRHQYPLVFRNNDLPGVMLSRAALRLINLYGIQPGRRTVVITADDEGYAAALECIRAGMSVAAVVDARPEAARTGTGELQSAGVEILTGMTIRAAQGSRIVTGARLGGINPDGSVACGNDRNIACDLILLATAWQGNVSLLFQSGCRLELDRQLGQPLPSKMATGVFACGEVLGLQSLEDTMRSGELAADAAVRYVRGEPSSWWQDLQPLLAAARQNSSACPISSCTGQSKNFVCLCEDVCEKDIFQGVQEGFDEIETLKRYSTVSMGPCQGRMCSRTSTELCGAATGRDFGAVGTTTARPPIFPVPLGALAGPEFHPVKQSSMHEKHSALGAEIMDMGVWKRPLVYSSVESEYHAVRERAGLIDVSTLGKLVVRGNDAAKLLDKVYTHWFSNLKPGRIRYGVMCDDSGTILDDGTVARLAPERYYITTTTGNADFVEHWMKWWVAGTGWCAHVTNVTAGYGAVNLAGPLARQVLEKLTEVDVSQDGFPYMACREGSVAGVPALLLRIGFVGETGWEIHFPAEYGEYLWDALLEAGKEAGIRPFGVEAQRLLRLEKKHVIVGQDTDALSNPFDTGMSWVVKLEKPDFIGRHALDALRGNSGSNRLVGFVTTNGGRLRDGNAVQVSGKLAGRVTSVRFSPYLNKYVGLAWVPAECAENGSQIDIHADGEFHPAVVTDDPFYDPEGARLR